MKIDKSIYCTYYFIETSMRHIRQEQIKKDKKRKEYSFC